MKILWTKAARNALEKVKDQMFMQEGMNDANRFRLKFTKKKEFLAIPISFNRKAGFRLFINEKPYATYFLVDGEWKEFN